MIKVIEIERDNKDRIIINGDKKHFILKGAITNRVIDIKSNAVLNIDNNKKK